MQFQECGVPVDLSSHSLSAGRTSYVIRIVDLIGRALRHPSVLLIGMMAGATAAKSGRGAWVAGGVLAGVTIYFGVVVTAMATRSMAGWVRCTRCHEIARS